MFFGKKMAKMKESLEEYKDSKKYLNGVVQELRSERNTLFAKHKSELDLKDKEFESKERLFRAELQLKVDEAVRETREALIREQTKNAVLLKEVEILQKAFENMGFDVKDMKEMFSKLVDGIVAKNDMWLKMI